MESKTLRPQVRGFTLIELLVVIAIIALLSAFLFPTFISAKKTSQCRCCQSNLKQLFLATELYLDAYDGRFPVQEKQYVIDWNSPASEQNWAKALDRYAKNARIPVCTYSMKQSDCKTNCSMAVTAATYPISYLGNGKIFGTGITGSQIVRSSKTVLFQCGGQVWNKCWLAPALDAEYCEWGSYTSKSWCNHNNGTNLSFVDGHIKWISFDNLSADLSVFNPS